MSSYIYWKDISPNKDQHMTGMKFLSVQKIVQASVHYPVGRWEDRKPMSLFSC